MAVLRILNFCSCLMAITNTDVIDGAEVDHKCIYIYTPWNRTLPKKQTGNQLVKKSPAFYGTRRFITTFNTARHRSLSFADQSSPCPISLPILQSPVYIIFLSTPGSSTRSLLQILYSPLLYPILVTCPAHLIPLNHPNYIFWGIQIFMLLIILPCYLSPLRSNYLPRHPTPEHPQPVRPVFTSTQNKRQNYTSVYFNLCIFRWQTGRKKFLHRTIPWLQSTPSSFLNGILIR